MSTAVSDFVPGGVLVKPIPSPGDTALLWQLQGPRRELSSVINLVWYKLWFLNLGYDQDNT